MITIHRASAATAITILAASLALTGCSSSNSKAPTSSTISVTSSTAAGTTAAPSSASTSKPVTATEKEFSIALSQSSFAAGTYTFTVMNAGKFPHNLTVEGPGVDKKASPTLPGGSSRTLTVALQKGSYELWCSVDSHKDKGMDMTITVS